MDGDEDPVPIDSRIDTLRAELERTQAALRASEQRVAELTDTIASQQAVRNSADTFRHLVENSPFGVYAVDADFRLVQVSAGAQKVFQHVRPLLGRDFGDVLRVIWEEPFASEAIERFRHTLATGEAYRSPSTVERRLDIGEVESYDWKIERVLLPDGRHGVVCHFYDLSERQRYEAALHAKTQQIESLLTHAPLGLAFFDREHRYVQVNEDLARMNGIAVADHIGRTIEELLPHNADAVVPVLDRVFETGEAVRDFEVSGETPSAPGVERHWLTGFYPVRDERGAVVLAGAWVAEITERKRAEQALREADRQKNEFIAVLSHELRNPLAPIRFAVPILERESLREAAARAVQVISRQVNHMTRLVDDLLDASRISRGKLELRKERVTLGAIVTAAVEAAAPLTSAARHDVRVVLADEPLWIVADTARMTQVITNLLTNSARYTPRGGRITIEALRDGDRAIVRVVDNGIGIPAEALPHLFEMFRQVTRPDQGQGGLGIGLALARRLVETHGGTIAAGSAGPGHGAEFTVSLPLSENMRPGELPPRQAGVSADHPLKVLIVDDNADLVEMLGEVVATLGHDVRTALDGGTAVAAATAYRPDVVLLDLGLPVMNGFEVAREIRRTGETAHARLIAISGRGQVEDAARTREAGFDHHLTKPIEPDALIALLTAAS